MFFRYTRFLEKENKQLKVRIECLETRNQELVVKMFSRPGSYGSPDEKKQPGHSISRLENRASCSCGWVHVSEDPAVLQNAISSHYRDSISVQRGRKSWPQAKAALERASEESK